MSQGPVEPEAFQDNDLSVCVRERDEPTMADEIDGTRSPALRPADKSSPSTARALTAYAARGANGARPSATTSPARSKKSRNRVSSAYLSDDQRGYERGGTGHAGEAANSHQVGYKSC